MAEQVLLQVRTLRDACILLLDHLEELEGPEVRLDRDFFWSIPSSQLYNVYEAPADLTVGQLSESVSNLQNMLTDRTRVTSYGLVWLADILRAAGDAVVR